MNKKTRTERAVAPRADHAPLLLGLDLGTSNIKVLITRADGSVVARASVPVALHHLPGGGVEQDIDAVWTATLAALGEAVARAGHATVAAIGVSSQGGAMQLLDQHGTPHGRVISWLDTRGQPYDTALTAELGRDWFARRTGHPGSALTLGQLARLRRQHALPPRARISFIGDVIVGRLCGRAAHDATSLSLAMLYNPALRCADPQVLGKMHITEDQLPALLSPRVAAGELLPEIARHIGLSPGMPVSPAVHDQYAAALGCHVTASGDVMIGAGTAWVLLLVADLLPLPLTDDAFVCTHIVEGLYGQILALRTGGAALQWALELTGLGGCSACELDAVLERAPAGCDGLRVQPFLAAPAHGMAAGATSSITGLRLHHGKAHLVRAVVEGLACELARHLACTTAGDAPVHRLTLCGAAARSRVTPRVIADVTGVPVVCVAEPDTSALGAAMIARGMLEPGTPLQRIAGEMKPATSVITPGPDRAHYGRQREEYLHASHNER